MSKIEREKKIKIDSIDSVEILSKLIENLLHKMNLSQIIRGSNNVITTVESGLLTRKIYFLPTIEYLNGKSQFIDQQIALLSPQIQNSKTATFFIVSSKQATNEHDVTDYFKNHIQKNNSNLHFEFWGQKQLIAEINTYFPDFWYHEDSFLYPYEQYYLDSVRMDSELRTLLKLDEKYQKMLDIFIEPRLSLNVPDKESNRPRMKKIEKQKLVEFGNYIITGDAGTGKSTLLKDIGKQLIKCNSSQNVKKNLPIYVKYNDLVKNAYDIEKTLHALLLKTYIESDIKGLFENYVIITLVDSIDELDKNIQNRIFEKLHKLGVRSIIATRNYEILIKECEVKDYLNVTIENFNIRQIQAFLSNFFKSEIKTSTLLSTLIDNKILDKMPVTPLTLSIISILYEEHQYEIPATITDIYDNFNVFLLGKQNVQSNIEFLDLTIKERILTLYGLNVLENADKCSKTEIEFKDFIRTFFAERKIEIGEKQLPNIMYSLTQGTGILFVDDNGLVNFKHNSFMEYYASREIFNHRRDLETSLVDKFTDFNWQNATIFYAGRTKDMPVFLKKVIHRTTQYNNIYDCWIAMSGLGYLLQALWLTDANIRKDGIIAALNLNLKVFDRMRIMADEPGNYFSNIPHNISALMNVWLFFKDFNSITLKDSLKMAFEDLLEKYKKDNTYNEISILYQLFNLALTLYSERIQEDEKLNILFDDKKILNHPIFLYLFDIGLELINPKNAKQLKKDIELDKKRKKHILSINYYLENPSNKLKFTSYDAIHEVKLVDIYTEGKTDAIIINHAYNVLTGTAYCYWNVRPCGNTIGKDIKAGATELHKFLESIQCASITNTIIAIFDNDMKGNQEFNGLRKDLFDVYKDNARIKKHKNADIFAIKLPIPPNKEEYIKERAEFMYFNIEHYFDLEFLTKENMVREVRDLPGIYEIQDNKKTNFAGKIVKNKDIKVFEDFKYLFEEIDFISNRKTQYKET